MYILCLQKIYQLEFKFFVLCYIVTLVIFLVLTSFSRDLKA